MSDDGDSEAAIIARMNNRHASGQVDVWEKIRTVYFEDGRDLQTANDRGYVKKIGGMRAWIIAKLKYSVSHAYDCQRAYNARHQFEIVREWYRGLNVVPLSIKVNTGPQFYNQVVKAYGDRDKPEVVKEKAESKTKQAAAAAFRWKARAEKLLGELQKVEKMTDYESLILREVEQDIAREEGSEAFPQGVQPTAQPKVSVPPEGGSEVVQEAVGEIAQEAPKKKAARKAVVKKAKPEPRKASRMADILDC